MGLPPVCMWAFGCISSQSPIITAMCASLFFAGRPVVTGHAFLGEGGHVDLVLQTTPMGSVVLNILHKSQGIQVTGVGS